MKNAAAKVLLLSLTLALANFAPGQNAFAKEKDIERKPTSKHYPAPTIEQLSSLKPKQLAPLKFPIYDQGGSYWYARKQYEKARQYWMTALRFAEQEVPPERARGLSSETESATVKLIDHLMYFIRDVNYVPGYYSTQAATPLDRPRGEATNFTDPDQRKVMLHNLQGQMRGFQEDLRWWERVKSFSKRALGEGHKCMYHWTQVMEQVDFHYKVVNTRGAIMDLERQLNVKTAESGMNMGSGPSSNTTGTSGTGGTNNNPVKRGEVENPWP
ncbi:MAG: hypothetical protein KA392_16835 [Candidatus Obscuribacter sp.]|nr:hypothetical protein [Candidatus Obscuribacter sp.]MBP6594913.1 hypothetical protein [Candidatus Obscuribacter sp.]MBP7576658.1 hypothetical protein [Candidatus Obscuribacter sp.]